MLSALPLKKTAIVVLGGCQSFQNESVGFQCILMRHHQDGFTTSQTRKNFVLVKVLATSVDRPNGLGTRRSLVERMNYALKLLMAQDTAQQDLVLTGKDTKGTFGQTQTTRECVPDHHAAPTRHDTRR